MPSAETMRNVWETLRAAGGGIYLLPYDRRFSRSGRSTLMGMMGFEAWSRHNPSRGPCPFYGHSSWANHRRRLPPPTRPS